MMKRLLSMMALLILLSAYAQHASRDFSLSLPMNSTVDKPAVKMQEMHRRAPGQVVPAAAAQSSASSLPFYCRPAGAFYCGLYVEDGGYSISPLPGNDFLMVKPYSRYTYRCIQGDNDYSLEWDYDSWPVNQSSSAPDLAVDYNYEITTPPTLYAFADGESDCFYHFQFPYSYLYRPNEIDGRNPAKVYAVPSHSVFSGLDDMDFLLSSKTMCVGGRNGDLTNLFLIYNGPVPFGDNLYGWWFGKNADHIDGMAQAFERPEHPYLLTHVYMAMGHVVCQSQAELSCKVYRLEDIPQYDDEHPVTLPAEPGELIAMGRATVDYDFVDNGNLAEFTLYTVEDGLEVEYTPTIDFPILVVVDGYNDPEADGLVDFTTYASADIHSDEGYGELAYLKCPVNDDQGNFTGEYRWTGLNNFFSIGEMKTGLTIYITAEMPFITFRYEQEDSVYEFDAIGGMMTQQFGDETVNGIDFLSCQPSEDEGWSVTCEGNELPYWLEIELNDVYEDVEHYIVNARVTAQPLPLGVAYREAVVRFSYPGTYLDYKFIQGNKSYPPCGPASDGEITIDDVNYLISLILDDMYDNCYDVNDDGELSVSDVNVLFDIMLSW